MLFSVAASTLAGEVHTKKLPSKKFTPKYLVLYRWDSRTWPQSEHTTSVARLPSEQYTSAIGLLRWQFVGAR
ncbi:hypothetical protein RHGRI_026575 [Rhododendron griersonianum]|uniref:Uncharacterized protein n=1 Tax=Rhododendron griersonianum TaxID=479676 RepID=A0AAV6IVM9_9ERIC|nr:hypothetical protein RHGRI_026575 [Rhododendron griersonianum]